MRIHKEHRIECTPQRFFSLIFDPEFERAMNLEGLASSKWELLEREVSGANWRLRAKIHPKDNMPGFIKKLVGDGFGYEELRTHQQGTDRVMATMTPTVMRDKLRMNYEMRVLPDGDNACKRIMDWEIEIKIFGIGGQIEKFAGGEIENGTDNSARFMNAYLLRQQKA